MGRWGVARALTAAGTAALLLAACAPHKADPRAPLVRLNNARIDGVNYSTVPDALAAERQQWDRLLPELNKVADPVPGRVRIVIPDADRLRPLVLQEDQRRFNRVMAGDALTFEVETRRIQLRGYASVIERTGAFTSSEIVEQNDVRDPDFAGADFLVWYQVRTTNPDYTGTWTGHWEVLHVPAAC